MTEYVCASAFIV